MPTSEERREVARRLREAWSYCADTDQVTSMLKTLYEIADRAFLGDIDGKYGPDLLERLADLIEPEPVRVCVVVSETTNDYMEGGISTVERKLSCGHTVESFYGDETYCPFCGAKVVDE